MKLGVFGDYPNLKKVTILKALQDVSFSSKHVLITSLPYSLAAKVVRDRYTKSPIVLVTSEAKIKETQSIINPFTLYFKEDVDIDARVISLSHKIFVFENENFDHARVLRSIKKSNKPYEFIGIEKQLNINEKLTVLQEENINLREKLKEYKELKEKVKLLESQRLLLREKETQESFLKSRVERIYGRSAWKTLIQTTDSPFKYNVMEN